MRDYCDRFGGGVDVGMVIGDEIGRAVHGFDGVGGVMDSVACLESSGEIGDWMMPDLLFKYEPAELIGSELEEGEIEEGEIVGEEAVDMDMGSQASSDCKGTLDVAKYIALPVADMCNEDMAVEDLSTYQKKFGALDFERFPSPTPSDSVGGGRDDDDDCSSQVSSALGVLDRDNASERSLNMVAEISDINTLRSVPFRSGDPRRSNAGLCGVSSMSKQEPVAAGNNIAVEPPRVSVTGSKSKMNLNSLVSNQDGPALKRQRTVFSVNWKNPSSNAKIQLKPRDPRRKLLNGILEYESTALLGHCSAEIETMKNPDLNWVRKNSNAGILLKPRDPRRARTNGTLQSATLPVHCSADVETKKNIGSLIPKDQANMQPVSAQVTMSDIAIQNTDSSKNTNAMTYPRSEDSSLDAQIEPSVSTIAIKKINACSSEDINTETGTSRSGSKTSWNDVKHLFDEFDDHQIAKILKERERRFEEQKKMFADRKLCLVLDLDHTLLNSAKFSEINPAHEEILRWKVEQERDIDNKHLFRLPHMAMWTKLRPGIWNFLEKASKLCELHVCTMGNKLYASEMAKILDPKGILFAGRVISKGDDGDVIDGDNRVLKTKDLEGVLGMESSVLILDDCKSVWPHHRPNLLAVERYIYFPCTRQQFGLPGLSLLEIERDENSEYGALASSIAVIERLHQTFFTHQNLDDADVRVILAAEQRKILRGCRIVFSHVFPVAEVNPHLHPLWKMAEELGASCINSIDENVTHVVANSPGTVKVKWAHSTGKFAVRPNWIEASALLYRRANEQDFAI